MTTIILIIVMLLLGLVLLTLEIVALPGGVAGVLGQVDKTAISKGARGTTIARLAPTGKAVIEGETVEVHAINHFIDPDRPIEVVAVEGYRIDVREITTDAENK